MVRVAATAKIGGAQGGTIRLVVTLGNVDQPVTIDAPSSGQPISGLLKTLGVAGGAGTLASSASKS